MTKSLLCGVPITCKDEVTLLAVEAKPVNIITINAQMISLFHNDEKFRSIVNFSRTTIDGQIPYLLFRLNHPRYTIKKLSGSDIIYTFLDLARIQGFKVLLMGGTQDSIDAAVKRAHSEFNVETLGLSTPFEEYPFSMQTMDLIRKCITDFKPDIIFLGYGAPKQEYLMADLQKDFICNKVKFAIGSGGTVDFFSRKIKRAPLVVQKLGLEGLFRFYVQPSKARAMRLIKSLSIFWYFIVSLFQNPKQGACNR